MIEADLVSVHETVTRIGGLVWQMGARNEGSKTCTGTPMPRCDKTIDDAVRHRMRSGLFR